LCHCSPCIQGPTDNDRSSDKIKVRTETQSVEIWRFPDAHFNCGQSNHPNVGCRKWGITPDLQQQMIKAASHQLTGLMWLTDHPQWHS
jgi:hypothetical protein